MIILYRIWQICVYIPVIAVWTIVSAIVTMLLSLLGMGRWGGYYPEILWARVFCWFAFVKVKVKGRENVNKGTAYMFLANHQSAYDIFSIYGYLGHNFRWMMKKSLERIPFAGWGCKASRQIFVDNSNPAATRRTIEDAQKELSRGMSLVVFPEGSRTPDGHMHRFKKGAFRLAKDFNIPVVPVTIDGAYQVMNRRSILPRPGTITITLHQPISPGPDGHDCDALMDATYKSIASSLPNP